MRAALTAALLLVATPAFAQKPIGPASALLFDHDGVNVERYEAQTDSEPWGLVTPTQQGETATYQMPFPAMTPGLHTIRVRACNIGGCGVSDPFEIIVVIAPAKPTGLRVGTMQEN